MMNTTFERMTGIKWSSVQARYDEAAGRWWTAYQNADCRRLRDADDISCPEDCPQPEFPTWPQCTVDMLVLLVRSPLLTSKGIGGKIQHTATPRQIVELIRQADALADEAEQLAVKYRQATRMAIEAYATEQYDAVKELVALCVPEKFAANVRMKSHI